MKSWRCIKTVLKVHSGSNSTYRCWTVCQGQLSWSLMLLADTCTYSHSLAHSVFFMEQACPTVRPHLSDAQRRMTAETQDERAMACVLLPHSCSLHYVLPGAHRMGREHVTSHVHSIDGEIQTWRTYYKYSSFRMWIFYDDTGNI